MSAESDEPIPCYVGGDEYDGLSIDTEDEEGGDLLAPSLIARLEAAEKELDAAEKAILVAIGVEDFDGLRARRLARYKIGSH